MADASPEWLTRYVLLYESEPEARARIGELFPAHQAHGDEFRRRHPGALLMIGPFPEPEPGQPGAMAIFTSSEAAEEFAAGDPFVVQGVVDRWRVRSWLVSPGEEP